MKPLLVLLLISAVSAFDFIRESFRYIDDKVDPCDNFYRHACPIGRFDGFLIANEYKDLLVKLRTKTVDAVWNNLEVEETFKRTHYKEISSPSHYIANLFKEQCEDQNVSRQELVTYLDHIERYVFGMEKFKCENVMCLSALASDHNCTRASQKLHSMVKSSFGLLTNSEVFQSETERHFIRVRRALEGANAVLDGDARDGVTTINQMIEAMKRKLTSWINQTAWAANNDAADAIIAETLQVHLYDNYAESMRFNINLLLQMDQNYLKCLRDTKNDEQHKVFCMFMATIEFLQSEPNDKFFTYFNAVNSHPTIFFSHLFYDMATNVEEQAGLLGGAGSIVGHELSHTLIENAEYPVLLPYFSNESMQCIQNQFQKTCDNFAEISCGTQDYQIDENGSDMLGLQLAYSLFEDEYEGRMSDEYIKVASSIDDSHRSITMEQLFFYSNALVACQGIPLAQRPGNPHSPFNIRVNAMAQHPGFKKAFNCASDSRMVQSFNDQCIIFGEGAPETRK